MAHLHVESFPAVVTFAINSDQSRGIILVAIDDKIRIRHVDRAITLNAVNLAFSLTAR